MVPKKSRIGVSLAAFIMGGSISSCVVPVPPPGRVIVSAPVARVGFYYHTRHGRVRFFAPGRVGVVAVLPPVGSFVETLPDGYTTMVVHRFPYYYYGGVYMRPYRGGYIIVEAPVSEPVPPPQSATVTPAAPAKIEEAQPESLQPEKAASLSTVPSSDTITVNVPNSKNGFTPVKLVKQGNGYVGPQGEFYPKHPTVDQLKALYGN